ncbi:cbb3-type cytochrome c oxidase N-terminal domain-containing protein [Aridibaculum aurantiacum]|uniref:cbb3-type cytochrome c oxidase N-terminal domain-containing protein n=1 Tax=Aridibaculum aurantiacum TaxID=2810307 RepID=UPI001A95CF67|nr:cbb3-type cytochrome c oxidase N-terminal domain-containing protein [Aridibaculum aurantiacum]
MKFPGKRIGLKGAALFGCSLFATATAFAAGPPQPSVLSNSLAVILLVVIVALLLAIALLANVVIGAAQVNVDRHKEKLQATGNATKVLSVLAMLVISTAAFAQDAAEATSAVQPATYGGLYATTFFILISIIALELLVLVVLVAQLRTLLAKDKPEVIAEAAEAKIPTWKVWWEKANSFKPAHEEKKIVLGHEYDGIRELDNDLPKWWLYGFYACIIFSFVYIYRFHVSGTGPSSEQEYAIAMAKAEAAQEEYLKKAANKVDENTVTLITDAGALAEGKKLFGASCAACHGPEGGGIVGPNLTDDYWLHKGSVKDVFKVIKYGVPEKGMKSWKDDFSPVQIANISSYIKSLHGTKPANPKEPQGELYTEETQPTADSTKAPDNKLAANR